MKGSRRPSTSPGSLTHTQLGGTWQGVGWDVVGNVQGRSVVMGGRMTSPPFLGLCSLRSGGRETEEGHCVWDRAGDRQRMRKELGMGKARLGRGAPGRRREGPFPTLCQGEAVGVEAGPPPLGVLAVISGNVDPGKGVGVRALVSKGERLVQGGREPLYKSAS